MNTNTRNLPIPQSFIDACLGNHIIDNSWGNDAVDFIWGKIDHKWVRLGVDFADRDKREEPDWPRFSIDVYDISDEAVASEMAKRHDDHLNKDEIAHDLAMDASTSGGWDKHWEVETEDELNNIVADLAAGTWSD